MCGFFDCVFIDNNILGVVGIIVHVAYNKVANVMLGFKILSFSASFGNVYLGLGSINIFSISSFIDHVNY
jgi:hypothetical protein